jgi:predicted permease
MNGRKYNDSQAVITAYRDLSHRLEQIPGVKAAGEISALPLSQMFAWGPILVEGRTPPAGQTFFNADQRVASGHYFEAMEIPLLRGRLFDEHDISTNPRVVVIDDNMAQTFWPREDALGKRIRFGGIDNGATWLTVVGVVGRIKHESLDSAPRIALYLPHAQSPTRAMNVVVRSTAAPEALLAAVKGKLRELDASLPVYAVRTMDQRLAESLARRRFSMLLLSLFGLLALALAVVGVYGVMAYLVNQGAREIGIRLALGATPQGILGLVVRRLLALAGTGVALGLMGALALSRVLASQLFDVSPADPPTFLAIGFGLLAVALLATSIPARRASRIDPAVCLRSE